MVIKRCGLQGKIILNQKSLFLFLYPSHNSSRKWFSFMPRRTDSSFMAAAVSFGKRNPIIEDSAVFTRTRFFGLSSIICLYP